MIVGLVVILGCQLAGELIVNALRLPVPGPVLGMAILFAAQVARGGPPEAVSRVADALLQNLSLLFVPAGVGVMALAGLIGADLAPISIALVISTLAALAATGLAMRRLTRAKGREP